MVKPVLVPEKKPQRERPVNDDFVWENGNPEVNGNYSALYDHYVATGQIEQMSSKKPRK